VTGTELALYVGNRLKVYLDTYARLSPSLASDNFRKTLVNLYAHLLEFLAHAIRIQQKRTLVRVAQAVWDHSNLAQFEEECNALCIKASEEARISDSELGREWRERLDARLQRLDGIHDIRGSLSKLQDKADLAKLITATGATYDSATEGALARCLPATRTELLELISRWAADLTAESVFWLCGKAGTGKSTIARTVAQQLDEEGLLGASFFFKRGWADRSHAKLLFPTIARQLADLFHEVGHAIASNLDHDSLICDKYLGLQFDKLLLQPLQDASQLVAPPAGVVVVIDALDECDQGEDIRTILKLLSKIEASTSIRLRIFVTSRPELPVELGFKDLSKGLHHDVRLEEVQKTTIERDIRIFCEEQFKEMKQNSVHHDDELPSEWPGDHNIGALVNQAVPLFIFAFTACRYISTNPRRNLAVLLQQTGDRTSFGIKRTYLPILNQVVAIEDHDQRKYRILDFKSIVGSIVVLFDPLSASALASILQVQVGEIGRALRPLHSVLNVPRGADGRMDATMPITLFHLSFRDFLVDKELESENEFHIEVNKTHGSLGLHCIRLLESGSLKEDICGLVDPGTRRADVAKSRVRASLPHAVTYACCYWVQHVVASGERISDDCAVHQFLKKHLLHWIEALSWLGKASDVIHSLRALQSVHDVGRTPELLRKHCTNW
jgi:hypothetical protein